SFTPLHLDNRIPRAKTLLSPDQSMTSLPKHLTRSLNHPYVPQPQIPALSVVYCSQRVEQVFNGIA
ncbi:MAG: hypothetical protein QXW36_00135, partial [Desulfurococcaceae archaeon]